MGFRMMGRTPQLAKIKKNKEKPLTLALANPNEKSEPVLPSKSRCRPILEVDPSFESPWAGDSNDVKIFWV